MDLIGKRAVFQHINGVSDTWNGITVVVQEALGNGWFRVTARLAQGRLIEHLALREELSIIEED